MMKGFSPVILAMAALVVVCDCKLLSQTKIKDVSDVGKGGKSCKAGVRQICHLDYQAKITSTLAKVCNNGNIETMRIPAGYSSPRGDTPQCTYRGEKFCDGDRVTFSGPAWLYHVCQEGTVVYKNALTGMVQIGQKLKFKGKKADADDVSEENEVEE